VPPATVLAFSPWVDMTASGASLSSLARRDVLIPVRRFAEIRALYLACADPRDPRASPHLGRFEGAPPVLLQSSRAEVLRDDARMMVRRLEADGVPVVHDEWDRVPHVWQIYQGRLPEADRALDRAAAFLRGDGGLVPQKASR
jgi:epsilon-lactone hydrolase